MVKRNYLRVVTTNKNNCLTKLYLDKKVEFGAVCFCLPPLETRRLKSMLKNIELTENKNKKLDIEIFIS